MFTLSLHKLFTTHTHIYTCTHTHRTIMATVIAILLNNCYLLLTIMTRLLFHTIQLLLQRTYYTYYVCMITHNYQYNGNNYSKFLEIPKRMLQNFLEFWETCFFVDICLNQVGICKYTILDVVYIDIKRELRDSLFSKEQKVVYFTKNVKTFRQKT